MAYFVKMAQSGGPHDVRAYKYAIYSCSVCGKQSDFTVNKDFQTRPRHCKHCKALDEGDKLQTLLKQKETLNKQKTEIDCQLLNIDTEIQELHSKINTTKQIEEITA